MLSHQVHERVLKEGGAHTIRTEMHRLLGVKSSGKEAGVGRRGDAAGATSNPNSPTCYGVDEAVGVLCDAIDWKKVGQTWNRMAQVCAAAVAEV